LRCWEVRWIAHGKPLIATQVHALALHALPMSPAFYLFKGTHMSLASFWILPACYWGLNGRSFATFPFPSRFDQGINAILVLGLQFYVGIGFVDRDMQLAVQIASNFMKHVHSIFICISIGFLFFSFLSPLLPNLQRL